MVKPKPHGPRPNQVPDGELDPEVQRDFFDCVARGDREAVQRHLDANFPVNRAYPTGKKPILLAVERGDLAMVQLLSEAGAHLDEADHTGWTPLMWAVRRSRQAVAAWLIQQKVPLNETNDQGQTALHLAAGFCRGEILHLLIDAGADVGVVDEMGHQALMLAVEECDGDAVGALLAAGNDPKLEDGDGQTPLSVALAKLPGDSELVGLLQSNKGARVRPASNKTDSAQLPARARSLPFGALAMVFVAVAGLWFLFQSDRPADAAADVAEPAEVLIPAGFAHIPGGPFQMGCSPDDLLCNEDEKPLHEVAVDSFVLAQHEVTTGDYRAFLLSGHALAAGRTMAEDAEADQPVTMVNWYDAVAYCNWMSAQNGLDPVYAFNDDWTAIPAVGPNDCADDCALKYPLRVDRDANGYRLPTEAEWEKAARGTELGNIYPWGGDPPNKDNMPRCNFDSDAVMPVGSFVYYRGYGDTYDLAGNVAEWVEDFYAPEFYKRQKDANPLNDAFGNERVIRGGSFLSSENGVRVSARDLAYPSAGQETIGFRLARNWR
ncbi:SUMF1/EgtB/PvdO family nonheme iron enzyme [Acanthopleuribacter pedis]|uniref:SUMF1/EgtB/PvdO family nonheme iron enzyme n=1 Tax=Acanthopleuribacter pedis TaxID=442870 RepID=A0A8J7QAK4_9BACT|nr:SUMF1/EgtB/PvdO family nonheme iron enzyme [Acanthopleuribacter pedis]